MRKKIDANKYFVGCRVNKITNDTLGRIAKEKEISLAAVIRELLERSLDTERRADERSN